MVIADETCGIKRHEILGGIRYTMKRLVNVTVGAAALLVVGLMINAYADDALNIGPTAVTEPQSVESSAVETPYSSFAIGADTYMGRSDMLGKHRFSDGMWAGSGAYYPSLSYLQWKGVRNDTVKLSMGMGELYTGSNTATHQPLECYWQKPVGNATVTVGKFWVPFGQQEWLYESKPGISAQWSGAHSSLIASANYSTELHHALVYLRGGRKIGKDAEVGASFALGHGLCSGSVHDRAIGLDTIVGFAGFRFYGEYNGFGAHTSGNSFKYLSGKLYYEKLGVLKPFVAKYWWHDNSDTLGNFRSTLYGVDYQLNPSIGIEGAISNTSDGNVSWLQLHWSWEKPFGISKSKVGPSNKRNVSQDTDKQPG